MTNTNQTAFAKAMNGVLTLNAKIEGVSLNLLLAMHESEVTFDKTWLELFCRSDSKTDMLNAVLFEQVPNYQDVYELSKEKIVEKNAARAATLKDKKLDAQRKVKTAENTLRNVIFALISLRLENTLELRTTNQKISAKVAEENGDVAWSQFYSIADLVKDGKAKAEKAGWVNPKVTNPKLPGSSTSDTAKKAVETGGYFPNAIQEMSKALMSLLKAKSVNDMTDEETEVLRQLEEVIITVSYVGEDGKVDTETLASVYEGQNALIVQSKSVPEVSEDETETETDEVEEEKAA